MAAVSAIPQALNAALLYATIGLIYLLIGRWTQPSVFWIFGWLHIVMEFASGLASTWYLFQRNRTIVSQGTSEPLEGLLIGSFSALANLAGSVAFLVAIAIVVLTNRPASNIEDHTFD